MEQDQTPRTSSGNGYLREVPLGTLLDDLRFESARFARAEVDLVRDELEDEARGLVRGATAVGVGGALLHASVFGVGAFGIALLSLWLPVWAAALIVTGIFVLAGVSFAGAGRERIKAMNIHRTLNEIKEDREWLSRMTHDLKAQRRARA